MRKAIAPLVSLVLCAAALPYAPVQAQNRGDQGQVRKEMRAGNVRSLREIEQIVLPQMRGMQYLGPEYDAAAMAYRLKFIRDGRVVFIDIDARSGKVLKRSN
ncbi:MAG: PepSY domain-containing protein [Novosphingobium sp.]|nr:PepSY domain-containing protein [Novosphingobium sp.]